MRGREVETTLQSIHEPRSTPFLKSALRVYLFALWYGLRTILAGELLEGLKLLFAPVGYWRFYPNAFVWQEFLNQNNPRVLDVSSPKLMSLILSAHTSSQVHATDLSDEKIFTRWQRVAKALKLKNYFTEYQDAQRLTYADESFDLVYSISVIEHIPNNGDSLALAEFRRVLKPKGVLVVEVPYRREREEIMANYDSKGMPLDTPQFYERHYDAAWLRERLVIDGLSVEQSVVLGESLPIDPWIAIDRLPRLLRVAVLPFEPLLAMLNYWVRSDDSSGHPLAALLVYRKVG
jgi:SAM-dependent methyltransferase